MTREKVAALGVPEKFCWENLIELISPYIENKKCKPNGLQYALERFYNNTDEDCLIKHFDRLFETTDFPFSIKKKETHADILKILNNINIEEVDGQIDILGHIYEQHLKTGTSSAGRDLGQFFTDRSICEYMTELCKPGFKSPGVPESVCDPTMGTGGFLTTFIKYYKKNYADTVIDWSVQQKQIHGCDTDPKVAGVARLNIFMGTGGNCTTNLRTHNSLYYDLAPTSYDIILANMPFGIKGINYDGCCERIKALNIRGTGSEPLFLQLMMISLNKGGRCAVVVPDGMLGNNTSCHNETRKYLLDKFELKRITKMKGRFFMNSGIQPSILFFENTGKPTVSVEFWEIEKTDKGGITEKMITSVPREKFDASSSFDMRRYIEADKPAINLARFPMVKLSSVLDLVSGKANKERHNNLPVPYYDSNGIIGYVAEHLYDGEYIITARNLSIGAVHYVNGPFYPSDHTINFTTLNASVLKNKFFYYWLFLNNKVLKDLSSGIKPGIRKTDVANLQMPLPPLAIQEEIVATLDRIYATSDMTKKLSLSIQTQMKELFNCSLKSSDHTYPVISSFCSFEKSKIAATKNTEGRYPFISLKTSTHNTNTLDNSEHVFISGIPQGNRLMKVKFYQGECAYSSLMFHCKLDTKVILPKFFYNYLRFNMDILNEYVIGVQPKFNHESFLLRKLIVPSLSIQQSVLDHLNTMEQSIATFERLTIQTDEKAKLVLNLYMTTETPDECISQSEEEETIVINEIITPPKIRRKKVTKSE